MRMLPMSEGVMAEQRPSALSDLRKGLGHLFRAARTTASKIPTKDIEASLVSGAKEVAHEVRRSFENVASTLEREVLGKRPERPTPPAPDDDDGHGSGEPRDPNDGRKSRQDGPSPGASRAVTSGINEFWRRPRTGYSPPR